MGRHSVGRHRAPATSRIPHDYKRFRFKINRTAGICLVVALIMFTCIGVGLLFEQRSNTAEPVALRPTAVPTTSALAPTTAAPTTTAVPTTSPTAKTTVPKPTAPKIIAPPKTTTTSPPAPKKAQAPVATATCASTGYGGVQPHVAKVGHFLSGLFGITNIGGKRGNAIDKDGHPAGLALDFMVGLGNNALGDKIADYVLAHKKELSVKYVIWRQRYNDGSGWEAMEDRGGATANHLDHVHVSFNAVPTGNEPKC